MSEPSKEVLEFSNKVYKNLVDQRVNDKQRFDIDPILVIAIANIIINVIKAIYIIYFSQSPTFIRKRLENPGILIKLIMRREIKKSLQYSNEDLREAMLLSISHIVRGYGDNEFKNFISSI